MDAPPIRWESRPGVRNGRNVLVDLRNGYVYHVHSNSRWRCSRYRSNRCRVMVSLENHEYVVFGEHSHPNDHQQIRDLEMQNWCRLEAMNSARSLHQIYLDATERYPASTITFQQIRRNLQRARSRTQPRIPNEAQDAHQLIENSPVYRMLRNGQDRFYYGEVRNGNELALIFINTPLLRVLQSSTEIHMDGTFRCVPRLFQQLATVHAVAYGYVMAFPIAFFVMTARTQALYDLCLRRLVDICFEHTGARPQPLRMVADYELAILQALQNAFPNGHARGCWYHSGMAMYRYACSLGLTAAYREIPIVGRVIRMAIALPLLPHERIQEGFQAIQVYAHAVYQIPDAQVRISVAQFLNYVRTFWLERIGAERISVYNQVNRTNNLIESWHRGLNEIMMVAHPGFWIFLGHLQRVVRIAIRDYQGIDGGLPVRQLRRRRDINRDRQIADAANRLQDNRITLLEFLLLSSNHFNPDGLIQVNGHAEEAMVAREPVANARIAFEVLLPVADPVAPEVIARAANVVAQAPDVIEQPPDVLAPAADVIAPGPVRQIIRRRSNGDIVARIEGNRILRVEPADPRRDRRIIPQRPVNGEPLLWENLPHEEVPNELVRLFFRPDAARPLPQPRMGPFDLCNICLDRPADWGIDCCEHHFCAECVRQLMQERVALGFRLRASVCPYCRQQFLISFPLNNPEQVDIGNE